MGKEKQYRVKSDARQTKNDGSGASYTNNDSIYWITYIIVVGNCDIFLIQNQNLRKPWMKA